MKLVVSVCVSACVQLVSKTNCAHITAENKYFDCTSLSKRSSCTEHCIWPVSVPRHSLFNIYKSHKSTIEAVNYIFNNFSMSRIVLMIL